MYRKKIKNQNAIIFWLAVGFFAIFLVLLAITTAYFSNQKNKSGQITLGELDFIIYSNESSFQNIMPSQNIAKTVSIVNSRNTAGTNYQNLVPIFFKFNLEVFIDGERDDYLTSLITPSFISTENYIQDGTEFYYNNILSPGQIVNLCDGLQFSHIIDNQYQEKSLNIVFNVNAIQSQNDAYIDLWNDAPLEWIEIIENLF